jgi:hypothetical protein
MKRFSGIFIFSLFCFLLMIFNGEVLRAQSSQIDWGRDTINHHVANSRTEKFRVFFERDMRNVTPGIFMPVSKLKAIVDACAANKIENVQFSLAVIRPEDTAMYFRKRPSLPSTDRPKVVNRPTLIMKVPRSGMPGLSSINSGFEKFMLSMLAYGYINLNKEYELSDDSYVYFDIGFICPPPEGCK